MELARTAAAPLRQLTLKWTWMWSRRTSTRKNLRAQISQVYFLSPWVSRCLFMLLLQENTCAHTQSAGVDACGPCQGLPPP